MDRPSFESPQEPFESPKELLDGTKERIAQLETLVQAVSETRDYEIITHTDPKTRDQVVKLRLKKRFPPRIRMLASSILKEMRTALDQAFCEAAVTLGRKDAKNIYFPFAKNTNDLKHVLKKHCADVDSGLVDYCLTFKPYYGGDSDGVLWSMSYLAGTTHRSSIGGGFQDNFTIAEAFIQVKGPMSLSINKWNDLHNELEVARVGNGGELHLKSDFTLRLKVIFTGQSHALFGGPLVQSLYELSGVVEGIVLGIEAETARLKRAAP